MIPNAQRISADLADFEVAQLKPWERTIELVYCLDGVEFVAKLRQQMQDDGSMRLLCPRCGRPSRYLQPGDRGLTCADCRVRERGK